MILDVDMGNSRIKWRLSLDPQQVFAHSDELQAQEQWRSLSGITRMRIAAVVDLQRVERVVDWARRELKIEAEVAAVEEARSGLCLAYSLPATLGVDRWLAMLAARQRLEGQDLIVISAGTALTIDYVDADGGHRGGYIIPGWQAAAAALLGATDRIVSMQPQLKKDWRPGTSTLNCVEGGIAFTYRSVLRAATQPIWADFQSNSLFITGGDGELLSSFAESDVVCIYDSALILQGLAVALP